MMSYVLATFLLTVLFIIYLFLNVMMAFVSLLYYGSVSSSAFQIIRVSMF